MNDLSTSEVRRIAFTVFQESKVEPGLRSNRTVAVTSAVGREGVTYVSNLICRELSRDPSRRALYCHTRTLARLPLGEGVDIESFCIRNESNYWSLSPRNEAATAWEFDASARRSTLETLGRLFDYVILDCPAVASSADISGIAGLVNSVLLVVGAGLTTGKQVTYAEQVIVSSGGTLSGCILNRRAYPVPQWIYKLLKGN